MPKSKTPVAPTLRKTPLAGDIDAETDASLGVIVAEEWTKSKPALTSGGRGLKFVGSSRAFLATDDAFSPAVVRSWLDIDYKKLSLLDRQLSFLLDVSQVGCGCNAAVYSVAMTRSASVLSSGYCDIQGYEVADVAPCVELDLFEGNRKAAQATLHTQQGHGQNGHCNQDGCEGNFGKDGSQKSYGPGSGGGGLYSLLRARGTRDAGRGGRRGTPPDATPTSDPADRVEPRRFHTTHGSARPGSGSGESVESDVLAPAPRERRGF